MTVSEALRTAAHDLAGVSDTPRLDAELLMADALGITRSTLLLNRMRDQVPPSFAALLARRQMHEPVAYITGRQDFWTLTLNVTPAVLIPRSDSETLIEAAVDAIKCRPPQRILDLGTGSGALLLAALAQWPEARGIGIEASDVALAIAQSNADRLGYGERARMQHGNWRHPGWHDALPGPFDLILCNPPYVETTAALAPQVMQHEPHSALFAGDEGLDDYRFLIPALPRLLAPCGIAILEIGASQRLAVSALGSASGFDVDCRQDLAGHDRAVILRQTPPT
ncbi:peptide chain release factor N(5)-glutamine methyltransferase [Blastomonas aquatica]|uniref:Release factor glutamine methyltransferase n=1 Tax=Blastomonas aquatica TaxID=1510276 RepID=A0ABQ1J406_9SPHN|nr:peptide chain release factor N(5)-glutamine methyltransferase [Blastomonas aquatica]GGB59053.1 release factor glutamine methyltransferase [Blastomonas aquatica]